MSALTMKDVAPYYAQYTAKYNEECSLSLDVFEELMGAAENDDALLDEMHTIMHSVDDAADVPDYRKRFPVETAKYTDKQLSDMIMATSDDMDDPEWINYFTTGKLPIDDRSPANDVTDTSMGSAYSYAVKFDAQFDKAITVLADAAIENKRGAAVIMMDLFRLFGEETVCDVWPVPGTYKPGHGGKNAVHAGDNEPWDKEDTSLTKADGTTGKGTKSFYADLVALSALGHDMTEAKEKAKKAIGNVQATKPEASAYELKLSTFKTAIARATNLAKRIAFLNNHTDIQVSVIMEDGTVKKSNKVLFIKNSKKDDEFDIITIGQLLALKVIEGGTYTQITGTTQRAGRSGTGSQENVIPEIHSLDVFDKFTSSYGNFFDRLNEAVRAKDMKAYNALLTRLNAAGSDDILLSMYTIMDSIEKVLSKPGIDKRLQTLIAEGGKTSKAA